MSREAVSLTRCVVVWSAVTAAVVAAACWVAGDLVAPAAGPGFEALLVRSCELAVAACGAWLWVLTTVVTLDALRGRPHRERRGVPRGVRRAVLGACGVALAGAAVSAPSYAAEHGPTRPRSVLAGLPLPDRATALTQLAAVYASVHHRHEPGETAAAPPHRHVVVRAGDTLWGLAEQTLPAGAGGAAVAERWHRLYALNRAVIGTDPDLIVPGQRLLLPTGLEEDL